MPNYLNEAFKKLDLLDEDVFSLTKNGVEELDNVLDSDPTDSLSVIDAEAETIEDIDQDYTGKIILDCQVCHSKIYEDEDNIKFEDDSDVVNIEDECPYCFAMDGYKIIGKVAPFDKEDEVETTSEIVERLKKRSREGKKLEACSRAKRRTAIKEDTDELNTLPSDFSEDFQNGKIEKILLDKNRAQKRIMQRTKNECADGDDVEEGLLTSIATGAVGSLIGKKIANNLTANEDFQKVDIETDTDKMTMTSDKDGKINVTTEPKETAIEPLTDDEKKQIVDVDIDDFDEETFDEIGESYLKKVYENVNSYKTKNVSCKGNKLFVEGLITFNSGKQRNTTFIFESKTATKSGLVKFLGENKELSGLKKAFSLKGRVNNGKLMTESLTYSYKSNNKNIRGIEKGKDMKIKFVNEAFDKQYGMNKEKNDKLTKRCVRRMNEASVEDFYNYEEEHGDYHPDIYAYTDALYDEAERQGLENFVFEVSGQAGDYTDEIMFDRDETTMAYYINTDKVYDLIADLGPKTAAQKVLANAIKYAGDIEDVSIFDKFEFDESLTNTIANIAGGGVVTDLAKKNIGGMFEDLGKDVDKYQKWIDYDMKRYGKISAKTNREIRRAGLRIVKDKYGDYEVIA